MTKQTNNLQELLEDALTALDAAFTALGYQVDDKDDKVDLAEDLPGRLDLYWLSWRNSASWREQVAERHKAAVAEQFADHDVSN